MHWLWVIIIGGIAGFIAKLIASSPNNPQGFLVTIVLGILGSFVATIIGRALHWYRPGEGAGLIGSIVGAVIILVIWHYIEARRYNAPTKY